MEHHETAKTSSFVWNLALKLEDAGSAGLLAEPLQNVPGLRRNDEFREPT
jgi:hypothetical protein